MATMRPSRWKTMLRELDGALVEGEAPAPAPGPAARPALEAAWRGPAAQPRAVVVQAPAGYGKTSLLASWRRPAGRHGAGLGVAGRGRRRPALLSPACARRWSPSTCPGAWRPRRWPQLAAARAPAARALAELVNALAGADVRRA
jgi:hypothetical protein